jgi:hypothetical protein
VVPTECELGDEARVTGQRVSLGGRALPLVVGYSTGNRSGLSAGY